MRPWKRSHNIPLIHILRSLCPPAASGALKRLRNARTYQHCKCDMSPRNSWKVTFYSVYRYKLYCTAINKENKMTDIIKFFVVFDYFNSVMFGIILKPFFNY